MKNYEEFKSIPDKFKIFQSLDSIKGYAETFADIVEAAKLLSEGERYEILKFEYMKKIEMKEREMKVKIHIKDQIINGINNERLKIQILNDNEIFSKDEILKDKILQERMANIISNMSYKGKEEALKDLREKLSDWSVVKIIKTMSPEEIAQIISNIKLDEYRKGDIVKEIKDEPIKKEILSKNNFSKWTQERIILTLSTDAKINMIKNRVAEFNEDTIIRIINSLGIEEEINYIKSNKDFLANNKISVLDIVKKIETKRQLEFAYRIGEFELTEAEERKFILNLKNKTKEEIDMNKINEKYKDLLQFKMYEEEGYGDPNKEWKTGKIILDLTGDLARYKGLDEFISINPILDEYDDDRRKKIIELCKICPEATVYDELIGLARAKGKDFVKAEEWVDSVLSKLNPEWTDVQKMLVIDIEIGKKISYTPEDGTEVEKGLYSEEKSLWKVIVNGEGVCNGIVQVAKYMLKRVGIESETITTKTHAFLKVKNIEIQNEEGKITKGDTLMDPTWDLCASRYGGLHTHFCKTYRELRDCDTGENGIDHNSHKDDKLEKERLIGIDQSAMAKLYSSVGLLDKDGNLPINRLIEKTEQIDNETEDFEENIRKKAELLKNECPEFATCINSTLIVMESVLFQDSPKFHYDRCIASRVFERTDTKKKAVLFVYFEKDGKRSFYYADKEKGELISLPQKEFEERFCCYESDKQLHNNRNVWDDKKEVIQKKERSSGEIVIERK